MRSAPLSVLASICARHGAGSRAGGLASFLVTLVGLVAALSVLFVTKSAEAAEQSVVVRSILDDELDSRGVESFLVETLPLATDEVPLGAVNASVSTTPSGWSPEMTRIALTCLTSGSSLWTDTTPTYDPDGDLAYWSDERGATMQAPLRVRAIADDTIDAAPTPCGAELFGHALDNDRHAPQKLPPPAHLEPVDLTGMMPELRAGFLTLADELPTYDRPAEGVRRAVERPPTAG